MQTPKRFHSLDALRGVAALAVVFFHWQNFFFEGTAQSAGFAEETQPFFHVFRLLYSSGNLAVDLFFSLSGFIFFWLYAEKVAARQMSAASFFVLRASRLYPLHFITLILVAVGQSAYFSMRETSFVYPNNDAYHFVLNLFLIPSIGLERGFSFNTPIWSVSVEAVLYVLFFAVCRSRRTSAAYLAGLSLLGLFVIARYYLPVGRGIGSFFLGGCTFLAYRWVLGRDERGRITAAVIGAAAALWLVTLYCSYNDLSLNTHPYLRVFAWKYPVVVLFPITILALALAETYRGALGRRLAVLGDISYSSYLWHFPLQLAFGVAVHTLGLTTEVYKSPLTFVLFFAMLIGLSMASYRYIEMPTQSYLRRRWVERSAKGQLA